MGRKKRIIIPSIFRINKLLLTPMLEQKIKSKKFKTLDEKLYLFYDTFFGPNTLTLWNDGKDAKQISDADKNWATVIFKK